MRGDDHLVPDLAVRLVLSSHLLVGHEAHDYVVVLGPSDLLVGQHVVPEDRLLGVRHVVLVDEHLGLGPIARVALLLTLLALPKWALPRRPHAAPQTTSLHLGRF